MSDQTNIGTEPVDERDDANAGAADASADASSQDSGAVEPAAPSDDIDPRARITEIEQELAAADNEIKRLQGAMTDLRRERDRLYQRGLPGRQITQAEAHQALVRSGQEARASRAADAARFRELTGGGPVPTVNTPAEQAARSRPRTA